MEEFFVPNFAFLVLCKTRDYYMAYQLVNWSVVDDFVFWMGFKEFCEYDEKIAKYCLKKYILEQICYYEDKDEYEESYKKDYLWLYFNKKLNFYGYLNHVNNL